MAFTIDDVKEAIKEAFEDKIVPTQRGAVDMSTMTWLLPPPCRRRAAATAAAA